MIDSQQALTLATTIPEDARNTSVRIAIEGVDAISILSTHGVREGQQTPDVFSLTHTSFSDPQAVQVTSQVVWNFGSLTIGRYAQLPDGYCNVTLRQGEVDTDQWPPSRSTLQFTVQAADRAAGTQINIQHSEPDFLLLRREHPADVDQYLRPVLRELGLESVMAADPMVAWRVFVEDLRPEPAMSDRVRAILPALDSDSFLEQQRAIDQLSALGLPMAIAVAHMDRSKLSAQQNVLLDAALLHFQPTRISGLQRLKNDVDFLLDCLYLDDASLRSAALEQLRKVSGKEIRVDLKGRFAERCKQIDALRQSLHATISSQAP